VASAADLRGELAAAAAIADAARRHVGVAAVLAEALRGVGQEVVLVGGAALEFYTEGGYSTADMDLLAEGGPPLRRIMSELGFARVGKDFVHEALELYVEFPGRAPGPSERTVVLNVGGRRLRVISAEDLLVDRLCAFKFWRSTIDGVSAMLLLELGDLDEGRVRARAREEDVQDALDAVRGVFDEATRRRLPRKRANALLAARMRALHRPR
jgi:hypothetical protein